MCTFQRIVLLLYFFNLRFSMFHVIADYWFSTTRSFPFFSPLVTAGYYHIITTGSYLALLLWVDNLLLMSDNFHHVHPLEGIPAPCLCVSFGISLRTLGTASA